MAEPLPGAFYDGLSARRRPVLVRFAADTLELTEHGTVVARWRYDDVRRQDGPAGVMRLRSAAGPELARLEIQDGAAQADIAARCPRLDEGGTIRPRTLARIVGWSLAAGASLLLTVVYLVPVAADWLAPVVPWSLERRLGGAVDKQVRLLFGSAACDGREGVAALASLTGKLSGAADLPTAIEVSVLPSPLVNALAMPGGRIYVLDGLIAIAADPDELAGVIAHEIGHVANRDSLRKLIQTGGSSFLLGLLFGDVIGGGTLVLLARVLVDSSYSRSAETRADGFAADIMASLGRSAEPMGRLLLRVTGRRKDRPVPFLFSHPASEDRLEALSARQARVSGPPLLSEAQWRALKRICGSG